MCVDSYHIILYYSACVLYVHVYLYVFLFCFVVIPCIYLYICCVSVHLYVYPYVSVCFSHARLLPHELLLLFSWYTQYQAPHFSITGYIDIVGWWDSNPPSGIPYTLRLQMLLFYPTVNTKITQALMQAKISYMCTCDYN